MLISAGCTFLLFLSFSQSAIIALQCLFCGVSVAAWNGIQVVTVELFPTSKRYHTLLLCTMCMSDVLGKVLLHFGNSTNTMVVKYITSEIPD